MTCTNRHSVTYPACSAIINCTAHLSGVPVKNQQFKNHYGMLFLSTKGSNKFKIKMMNHEIYTLPLKELL